jgi:hypothetical protein
MEKEATTTKPRTAAPNDLMLRIEPRVPGYIEDEEGAEDVQGPTQAGAQIERLPAVPPLPSHHGQASGHRSPHQCLPCTDRRGSPPAQAVCRPRLAATAAGFAW